MTTDDNNVEQLQMADPAIILFDPVLGCGLETESEKEKANLPGKMIKSIVEAVNRFLQNNQEIVDASLNRFTPVFWVLAALLFFPFWLVASVATIIFLSPLISAICDTAWGEVTDESGEKLSWAGRLTHGWLWITDEEMAKADEMMNNSSYARYVEMEEKGIASISH